MSIVFNWSISKMYVIPLLDDKTNVVTKVDWLVKAVDDKNNMAASASGTCSFTLGSSFDLFDKLTEQQVLGWCFVPEVITSIDRENVKTTITKFLKDEGEAQVTGQIARQLAQKQSEPALPWL